MRRCRFTEEQIVGVLREHKAVEAACSLEWSQRQVEGQITKVKLIRRQMYGRGNFDLVRKWVLHAA